MEKPCVRCLQFAICNLQFAICNCLAILCLTILLCAKASAHPLLVKFYERTVDVRLSAGAGGQVVVDVQYELELNQLIALLDAKILLEQRKEEEPGNAKEYYAAFARVHAPILADRLYATLDDQALEFTCVKRDYEVKSSDGTLHCKFTFRGSAKPPAAGEHRFAFEEGAYKEEPGRVLLSLHADPSLALLTKDESSVELKNRKPADLKIGDDERMRRASATFTLAAPSASKPISDSPTSPATTEAKPESDSGTLLDLLFDTRRGFALLLVLAAGFGAFHALTPGHGKTLVASYLVGERGTLFHALLLGIVTTLTHTGAVLILAGVLWFFPSTNAARVQIFLGVGGGFLVAAMGFWLLYRRLAGQADHFHVGRGHHHHHSLEHAHELPSVGQTVSVWSLIGLGISGGIVPCTDAIVMLLIAIGKGYLDRALPLLLAFSAGLAGVLIAIGMLVVTSTRFAGSHFGQSRLFRALPLISASLVTVLGLWLCFDALAPLRGK
jgi:ABC-type nickel/cobalt efflux system permease component RcnA